MATNERFDEYKMNTLEKVKSANINSMGQLASDAVLELAGELTGLTSEQLGLTSVIVRGLRVLEDPGGASMDLTVEQGLGLYKDTAGWSGTRSRIRPLYLDADTVLTVPAADPTLGRIDLVVCKAAHYEDDTETTEIKNTTTGVFTGQSKATRIRRQMRDGAYAGLAAGTAELAILAGTPDASPVAPTPAADEVILAQYTVAAAATSIAQAVITDRRVAARGGASRPLWMGLVASAGTISYQYAEGGVSVSISKTATGTYEITVVGLGVSGSNVQAVVTGNISAGASDGDRTLTVGSWSGNVVNVYTREVAAGPAFAAVDSAFHLRIEPLYFNRGTAY